MTRTPKVPARLPDHVCDHPTGMQIVMAIMGRFQAGWRRPRWAMRAGQLIATALFLVQAAVATAGTRHYKTPVPEFIESASTTEELLAHPILTSQYGRFEITDPSGKPVHTVRIGDSILVRWHEPIHPDQDLMNPASLLFGRGGWPNQYWQREPDFDGTGFHSGGRPGDGTVVFDTANLENNVIWDERPEVDLPAPGAGPLLFSFKFSGGTLWTNKIYAGGAAGGRLWQNTLKLLHVPDSQANRWYFFAFDHGREWPLALLRPARLQVSVATDKIEYVTAEPVVATVTVSFPESYTGPDLLNVQVPVPTVTEDELEAVPGQETAVIPVLTRGQSHQFTFLFTAKLNGIGTISAHATAVQADNARIFSEAFETDLFVGGRGDLVLVQGCAVNPLPLGNDQYSTDPPQVSSVTATRHSPARHTLFVENESEQVKSYILRLTDPSPDGWVNRCVYNGADVTEQLKSPDGLLFSDMAPLKVEKLQVELAPGRHLTEGSKAVPSFTLDLAGQPPAEMDRVRIEAEFIENSVSATLTAQPVPDGPGLYELTLTVKNESTATARFIIPNLPSGSEGTGGFEIVSHPELPYPESLDGGQTTEFKATIRRTLPGPLIIKAWASARVMLTDGNPNNGRNICTNEAMVDLDGAVTIKVETDPPGTRVRDDAFLAKITIETTREAAQEITFPTPVLTVEDPEILELGTVGLPPSITLSPTEPKLVIDVPLFALKGGASKLTARATATEAGRAPVALEATMDVTVAPLDVEIILPEETLALAPKEPTGGPEDDPGYEPLEFEVIVRVSVPEDGDPVESVSLQGFDDSSGGMEIDLVQATGLEEDPWADVQPQPVPAPVYVSQRSEIGVHPGLLLPGGDPVEFRVKLTAERPGTFDVAALITAAPEGGGGTLFARGNKVADIKGDLVLAVQLEVLNQPARITEGEAVEITGTVENLTLDQTIKLDPLIIISSGQGVPLGPVALDDPLPPPGTPGIFNPTLEPGQRERFRLRVQTVSLAGFDQREMARRSVVIDFALSGKVRDEAGAERDLEPEATLVEWGNGRHEVEGATFLRAEVDADLRPSRLLDPDSFYIQAAGNAIEQLAKGGAESVMAIPQMLGSLPSTFWGLANASGSVAVEKQIASYNAGRYLWAWLDWKSDVWLGLESQTREQQLQLIADELAYYYGPKLGTVAQVKGKVDAAITGYFAKVIDYQKRAYDASGYGFNEELARIVGEPFRPIGKFAIEETAASLAIASWIGRTARSGPILEEVAASKRAATAAAREQVDEAVDAVRAGGDPRLTEMPDPMKALPNSTPILKREALEGFGVDPVSDSNLIKLTDAKNGGMPIFAALRSRADETIDWMKTQRGIVVKPMTFKPKNVNADDVNFLGYRDGVGYGDANGVGAGDRGATLLAEPIPRQEVLRRIEGLDGSTRRRVLKRHNMRWEEWYGVPCCDVPRVINSEVAKLMKGLKFDVSQGRSVGKGTLAVPKRGSVPQPDINAETVGPGILDQRQFELRQVNDPPDNELFPNGRQYFECWLEDDLGVPGKGRGAMRRIAGDIDLVAVGMADGSALPVASVFTETVAENLQHAIDMQHPWSSSLTIPKLFEKFVNSGEHRWHPDIRQRGEPLLIYVNGERRIGWFHPTRAITRENPLQGFMWLDGSTADVDDVIRFQQDMRGFLPDPSKVNPPLVKPSTSVVRQALLESDINKGTDLVATCSIHTARTAGTLYRLSRATVFEKRNEDGTWSEADPASSCTEGGIVVMPETFLSTTAPAGTLRLPILEELLGFDWREMFQIGDQIVISPGTPIEEHRTIVARGSLIIDRPLVFTHGATTSIVSLGNTFQDSDADGVSDARELVLGTDPDLADTDGDGFEDFTEILSDMDPLQPTSPAAFPLGRLEVERSPAGVWELIWPAGIGMLESSDSLATDDWQPVGPPPPADGWFRYLVPFDAGRQFYRVRN